MSTMCCLLFYVHSSLRLSLFHDSAEVRASTLRAIRYFLRSKKAVASLYELNMHHLIARSMDFVLDNQQERIQALRLIRHILAVDPNIFSIALGRCLSAIVSDNTLEKDSLLRACIATIAEFTLVNGLASARSGCISTLVTSSINAALGTLYSSANVCDNRNQRNTFPSGMIAGAKLASLELFYPNIAILEAILAAFLHLYNWPETRKLLAFDGTDLYTFIAPFMDTYSFYHASVAAKKNNKPNFADIGRMNGQPEVNGELRDQKVFYQPIRGNNNQQQQAHVNLEQRSLQYSACKNALLSVLFSFPGLFFMCRTENKVTAKTDKREKPWDYSQIYNQPNEMSMRSLHASIRFFGNDNQFVPKRVTQMMSGIEKAIQSNCLPTSSFFTTTSFDSLNPMESLISNFHLPYPEIHLYLLEMIFELFGLRVPENKDNFENCLQHVYFLLTSSSSDNYVQSQPFCPDEWHLYSGFVAKEGAYVLPCDSDNRLNYAVVYHALLLQSLVESGLLEALITIILDSEDEGAVNLATILIGELIHMSGKYLPASLYAHRCQSLPTLVAASVSDCKARRSRAQSAIHHLDSIHELKKRKPQPASLFLEQQIQFCKVPTTEKQVPLQVHKTKTVKITDDLVISLIKSSQILKKTNFKDWNWDIIAEVLRRPGNALSRLEDKETHRVFVRRLLDFFKPSQRYFSLVSKSASFALDMNTPPSSGFKSQRRDPIYVSEPRKLCKVATFFVDFLLNCDEVRIHDFVDEFIKDLDLSIKNIATKNPSPDEILIPSRLLSTLSNHYFILLGRFTHFTLGRKYLETTNIYEYLLDLVSLATNDIYIKLIVSSLDYSQDNAFCRPMLSKVLTSSTDLSRLYATQFLRVLLRANVSGFSDWGTQLLVVQLYDNCQSIALAALDILDEACSSSTECLQVVIEHKPALLHLGDPGILFLTRFVSHPTGLKYVNETNLLETELNRWQTNFCARYVRVVEDSLNELFTCHQRSEQGIYERRSERGLFPNLKRVSMSLYAAPHLYGQLVKSEKGLQIVKDKAILEQLTDSISRQMDKFIADQVRTPRCKPNEADILRMKAAIWAVGHLASSEEGAAFVLHSNNNIVFWIVTLARQSIIISLRGTCYYVICLIASTKKGSEALVENGWIPVQHSQNDAFPVNQQEYDNFYLDGRPRFMSDPDRTDWNAPGSLDVYNKSNACFSDDQFNSGSTLRMKTMSDASSRSSSSSYLAVLPSPTTAKSTSKEYITTTSHQFTETKATFIMSSMSSVNSVYSNTSSVGCLPFNGTKTVTLNRPRSSSDCLSIHTSKTAIPVTNKLGNKSKPECKDSGILEQNAFLSANNETKSTPKGRCRKISAPCFPVPQSSSREHRSASNESTTTNNTAFDNSRSTSFAEYSTSSSVSIGDSAKLERSVVRTFESPEEKLNRSMNRSISTVARSANINGNEDPYPSTLDAHGYAQLRAIQKQRVQNLSTSTTYFGGITSPIDHFEDDSLLVKSPSKLGEDNFGLEQIFGDSTSNGHQTTGRQRKLSRVLSPPSNFMLDAASTNMFALSNNNNASESNDDTVYSTHSIKSSFHRAMSVISKHSNASNGSAGLTLDDLSVVKRISSDRFSSSGSSMCLALPGSLGQLFYLEEVGLVHFGPKLVHLRF